MSAETSSGVFSARDTVTLVTPTSLARSLNVTRPVLLRARRAGAGAVSATDALEDWVTGGGWLAREMEG
ncbi:hypothetical protein MAFF211271_46970 (plasmid) [Ralstonia syzygii subsp. indonesiensis]|nr:hypothetical protein MAFF211271_46970 [Ralstonia pseudosolanacearum]